VGNLHDGHLYSSDLDQSLNMIYDNSQGLYNGRK